MVLSIEEVKELTRAKQARKVRRVLARLKIPFKLDDAGFPIVLRRAVEAALSEGAGPARKGPNLNAMEALRAKTEKRRHRTA